MTSARQFAQGIRAHWRIENRLHCIKYVIAGIDTTPFSSCCAAANWFIIRTVAINITRMSGYDFLTKAERFLAHDIGKLFLILE